MTCHCLGIALPDPTCPVHGFNAVTQPEPPGPTIPKFELSWTTTTQHSGVFTAAEIADALGWGITPTQVEHAARTQQLNTLGNGLAGSLRNLEDSATAEGGTYRGAIAVRPVQ